MQCVDCRRLRHDGECEPVYEDEPDTLEMLRIDAIQAVARYWDAKRKEQKNEPH